MEEYNSAIKKKILLNSFFKIETHEKKSLTSLYKVKYSKITKEASTTNLRDDK